MKLCLRNKKSFLYLFIFYKVMNAIITSIFNNTIYSFMYFLFKSTYFDKKNYNKKIIKKTSDVKKDLHKYFKKSP